MPSADSHTYREILSQPSTWSSALDRLDAQYDALRSFLHNGAYDSVVLTGCGSTYYLARAAAPLFQSLANIRTCALPASEIWLNPTTSLPPAKRTLLIAVSRSGETTETLKAVTMFTDLGHGDVLTLSCSPDRPLARMGTLNLVFPEAQEQSIAQTRAFSTLYLACVALAAVWAGRDDLRDALRQLPEAGAQLIATSTPLATRLAHDERLQQVFFLGSALRHGLACELSLKMKEMSLSVSEPFHTLEFRHGPQSMANQLTLIVALLGDDPGGYERDVLKEMQALGTQVVVVGQEGADVALPPGIPEAARGVLYLPFGQLLAHDRAVSKGLDPDHPQHLQAVVRLDDR